MAIFDYFSWHYATAFGNIWGLLGNYTSAVWHRFLIGRHFKTLFAPWHRRQPSDLSGGGGFGAKILDAVSDFYIRILAALVRLTIITLGLITEVVVFIGFVLLFLIWILWPAVVVFSIARGLALIF